MTAVPITTHVADALSRLPQDLADKNFLIALIGAMAQQDQDLEDAMDQLGRGLDLTALVGQQLDDYGTLVGIGRNGLDDSSYRALLAGTIGSNYSDGSQAVLLSSLAELFESNAIFKKDPNSNAGAASSGGNSGVLAFGIGSPGIPANLYGTAISTFLRAVPAGIGVFYLTTFSADGALACAGPQSWVRGFGDVNNPAVGGKAANVIYSSPVL